MKKIILFALLLVASVTFGQSKMITKTGNIVFEASVPNFEQVKAKNEGVTCVLNAKTGDIATLALMKGFRFKVALMEEHFNENYAESDKYRKSTFKGKIVDFDIKNLTDVAKDYTIKGKLELHGKTKEVIALAKIRKTAEGIEIITDFSVLASDFGIIIPAVVKNKLTNKVNVRSEFLLKV